MKKVFIVHGWSGSPRDNWLPWLKVELGKLGHQVFVPALSDSDNPLIETWVRHLAEVVGVPDKDTYFIGHSIGCQAILRYLDGYTFAPGETVGGALFVAGWFNLENMETDEEHTIAQPWIETPINLEKIKTVLPKSTLIISDNDPYGAFEENRKKFAKFVTKEVVLHNAEHITEEREQAILQEFVALTSSSEK